MKYLIKIFSDFCSSESCKINYEKLCEAYKYDNYGPDKDFYITNDDNYTHAIILNKAMPTLSIPKENVIGLSFEPPEILRLNINFINYAKKYIGKFYIGSSFRLPEIFNEHFSFMWHNPPISYIPTKSKLISIVFSNKKFSIGHKYRNQLVLEILKTSLPIDIYGFGCNSLKNKDLRIKGNFSEYEPYLDYQFSICVENYRHNGYFSEKVINPLLTYTTPIYLGCFRINEYFPNMIINLSGILKQDMLLITNICNNPEIYKKTIDIDLVKNKINLIKNLDYLFS